MARAPKNSKEIAEGFDWNHRERARFLRRTAMNEGMQIAAATLEAHLNMNPDLDAEELMYLVTAWIKEMKEGQ